MERVLSHVRGFRRTVPCGNSWMQLAPGDLIYDSSHGCIGRAIRFFTCSALTHVRAVCRISADDLGQVRDVRRFSPFWRSAWPDGLYAVESTTTHDEPCLVMHRPISGVQVHYALPVQESWLQRSVAPLSSGESHQLTEFLLDQVGTSYDLAGAGLAGTTFLKRFIPWTHRIGPPYFCDELAGRALLYALQGRILPEFQPGEQSPGSFSRLLVKSGLYYPLVRFR